MDPERRIALEERRRFMRERNEARAFRALLEPAWTQLEEAGEDFRVYRIGGEPAWNPRWIPSGYSYIPWRELDGVGYSGPIDDREAMAQVMRELLAERLGPEDEMLFIGSGKPWSIGLKRAVFDRHAVVLLDVGWDSAYVAAPPAQWLVFADWSRVMWKDS